MPKLVIADSGSPVSEKRTINFVDGSNTTVIVTDDGDSANVQIDATGGGSAGAITTITFSGNLA